MIHIQDLSISYCGETIFENATFQIHTGERCALVGRNGSGKTTLFRLLIGQEQADNGAITLPKEYHFGYLNQHIAFSKPTVLEEAVLGLRKEEQEATYKAEKILFGLGFTEEQLCTPTENLSGGFQLRLHLTKVLLAEPHCLLLDEPTNYLDILSRRFLIRFLKNWQSECIVISHDREFLDSISTHTLGVHRNTIRKTTGGCDHFFHTLLEEEEIYEKTRLNQAKKKQHLQSYIDRFGAKASKATQAQSRKKQLNKLSVLEELKKIYSLDFSFLEKPFHGKKLIDVDNLSFAYSTPLIHNLSLSISRGEKIAIIGKNGYGKSTLLKLIAKEFSPQSGSVRHFENTSMGYFGQTNIERLNKDKTIEEELEHPELDFQSIKKICGTMMFQGDRAKKKIKSLSGGEKSRVLLGKILTTPCNLLLLDEPTHHLDVESIEALIDAINRFSGGLILVTHSEEILRKLNIETLIVCHQDRQSLFRGTYDEFLAKIGWEEEKKPPKKEKKLPKTAQKENIHTKRKIASLEKEIISLEEKLEKKRTLLITASQEGNATDIQKLMKETSDLEKAVEESFKKLLEIAE